MNTTKQRFALFFLALFLGLQALAASPTLHALVHPDANRPTHECPVTFFTHGRVHASEALVEPAAPVPIITASRNPAKVIFVSRQKFLRPGRGPPFVS